MKSVWSILVLAFLLGACKKGKETTVFGTVTEGYDGVAIEGASLEFAYTALNNGTYSSGYTELGSTTTDADGSFSFSFENVSVIDYRVRVRKEGYFFQEHKLTRDQWRLGQENNFSATVYEEAVLNFRFYNSGNSGNTIIFNLKPHSEGCSGCCGTNKIVVGGINDTSFSCQVYGNQQISYELLKVNAGGSEEKKGTIDVSEPETLFEYDYQ